MIKILRQLELLFPVAGRVRPHPSKTRHDSSLTEALRALSSTDAGSGRPVEAPVGHDFVPDTPKRRRKTEAVGGKSDEFLQSVWRNLRSEFFPNDPHVDDYIVTWSARPQKRVLASCNIRRRRIVVAQELFEPSAARWIAPVLYHEMCHAVIGEGVHLSESGKRLWHGRQFRQLEARHPDIEAMNAWIATGGWAMAVRSHRARRAWRSRRGVR